MMFLPGYSLVDEFQKILQSTWKAHNYRLGIETTIFSLFNLIISPHDKQESSLCWWTPEVQVGFCLLHFDAQKRENIGKSVAVSGKSLHLLGEVSQYQMIHQKAPQGLHSQDRLHQSILSELLKKTTILNENQ